MFDNKQNKNLLSEIWKVKNCKKNYSTSIIQYISIHTNPKMIYLECEEGFKRFGGTCYKAESDNTIKERNPKINFEYQTSTFPFLDKLSI